MGKPIPVPEQEQEQDEQDPNQEQDEQAQDPGDGQSPPQSADGEDDGQAPDPDEDDENEEAAAKEAAELALAEQALRGKKLAKATEAEATPATQVVQYAEYDAGQFLADVQEQIVPAIVEEVIKALKPEIAKAIEAGVTVDLKTLRTRTANLVKALDTVKLQVSELAEQGETITKALGAVGDQEKLSKALTQKAAEETPAGKEATENAGGEPIEKGNVSAPGTTETANGMTKTEAEESVDLITKAIKFRNDHNIAISGLTLSVAQDANRGVIDREKIAEIRKSLEAAEASLRS